MWCPAERQESNAASLVNCTFYALGRRFEKTRFFKSAILAGFDPKQNRN
jgi:hypothetical protein